MAINLGTLPDETLAQVFGYIENNQSNRRDRGYRRTICALTRTSRRLSNLAHDELYRHVVLDVDNDDYTPWAPHPFWVEKLVRTCQERPNCLQSMRRFDITWSLDRDGDHLLESLLDQLSRSISLTHLCLSVQRMEFELSVSASPCAVRPLLQRDQSFMKLQFLKIISLDRFDTMPAETLYSLASLPSLKSLHVGCAISLVEEEEFYTSPQDTVFGQSVDLKDQSFGLETLEVVKSVHNCILELILSRCPKLKQLVALPIGADEHTYNFYYDDNNCKVECVNPTQLSMALLPVRSTLQYLTLLSGSGIHPDFRLDNSVFRLSPFKVLTHLTIPVTLLSQGNPKITESDTVRTMFPTSLEYLEFQVAYPSGIFWSDSRSQNRYTHFLDNSNFTDLFTRKLMNEPTRVQAALAWYLSLLSLRRKSLALLLPHEPSKLVSDAYEQPILPNLRTLRVIELFGGDDEFDHFEFVGQGYCPGIFWDLGVDFEVVLRVPMGWNLEGAQRVDEWVGESYLTTNLDTDQVPID